MTAEADSIAVHLAQRKVRRLALIGRVDSSFLEEVIREETLRCLCIDHPPNHLDPRRRRSGGTQGTRKPACVQIHLCVDSPRGIGYALALSGSHITETWRHHPQADHLFHYGPSCLSFSPSNRLRPAEPGQDNPGDNHSFPEQAANLCCPGQRAFRQ